MATCSGKKKNGDPCGMKAGEGGVCVNHREKTDAPATPAPAAAAEERALMPGEKPDQGKKPATRRRAAAKAPAAVQKPAEEAGTLGQVLGGVLVGLAIVTGVAWAVFSPAESTAAEATKRAVS